MSNLIYLVKIGTLKNLSMWFRGDGRELMQSSCSNQTPVDLKIGRNVDTYANGDALFLRRGNG